MNLTQTPDPLKKFVCKKFFWSDDIILTMFQLSKDSLCKKEAKERQFSRSKGLFPDIKEI